VRKLLLVQFDNSILTVDEDQQAKRYYDKLYSTRPGYHRFGPTWEIPKWISEMLHNFPFADVLFARTMAEILDKMVNYDDLAFSALDCNKHLIKTIACNFKGRVFIGGYCDSEYFDDLYNVYWCDTIETCCNWFGVDYKPGVDYRHFNGCKTVARLTMSTGCKHHCKFCVVPDAITQKNWSDVIQQIYPITHLNSPLVYLDDKTFGQAKNHIWLPAVYRTLKNRMTVFDGFIVQTTASQLLKLDDDFLLTSGIRYVELGVESFNDSVLKPLCKPASEKTIQAATDKLKRLGIKLIPNIMIGLPGESSFTYIMTINWLYRNIDAISHVNVYSYVNYSDTKTTDENRGGSTDLEKIFATAIYEFGNTALDRG